MPYQLRRQEKNTFLTLIGLAAGYQFSNSKPDSSEQDEDDDGSNEGGDGSNDKTRRSPLRK